MAGLVSARHRLFTDDYGSTGQSAWHQGLRGPGLAGGVLSWRRGFLGQLRLDSLLSRRLIIPDSHLFDGAFFQRTEPDVLRRELGRPEDRQDEAGLVLPIVLRLREPSLELTIANFLKRRDGHSLNRFVFKSIPDAEARDALASDLGNQRVHDLDGYVAAAPDAALGVANFLRARVRDLGFAAFADEWIGPLEVSWSAWLAASSWLPFEPWPSLGVRDFDLWKALRPEWLDPRHELQSDVGREALATIAGHLKGKYQLRGEVSHLLAGLRLQDPSDEAALNDLDHLEAWYTRIRYRAIATQHDAAFLQSIDDGAVPFGALQRFVAEAGAGGIPEVHRVELPDEIVSGLANLDDEAWQAFVRKNQVPLARWWSQGRLDDFRSIAAAVAETISPPPAVRPFDLYTAIPILSGALAGVTAGDAGATAVAMTGITAIATVGSGFGVRAALGTPQRRVTRRIIDAARDFATPTRRRIERPSKR